MTRLSVYSMFAGIGGIDLGLERTGAYETVLFSEIDPYACRVLAHHWPSVPNVGDCTQVDYADWVGKVNVIAAGFPCQDISIAGKQEGIKDGTRSGLWGEVVRAIRELRPSIVILENVAAIVTSNDGRDFSRVLADLHESGYDAEWRIVRASDVGAYHQRARWFCVAWPRELADSGGYRLETGGSEQNPAGAGVGEHGVDSEELEHPSSQRPQTNEPSMEEHGTPQQRNRQGHSRVFTRPPEHSTFWGSAILHRGRPVEPSIPLLSHGVPDRVARIRATGNAVVPQVAEYVGRMALNAIPDQTTPGGLA